MDCLKVLVLMFVCVYSNSPISIIRDRNYPIINEFEVFWNVPTRMCKQYGIKFEDELNYFDIKFNAGDEFIGDRIAIFYDPGAFPAMIKVSSKKLIPRNGGIPQKGSIDTHLEAFKKVVEGLPESFDGLGVIDFEAWRPIFRQNWNDQNVYKDMSVELEKNRTTITDAIQLNQTAAENFEKDSKKFMKKTLELAKSLRQKADWGYYGFPHCYNFRVEKTPQCTTLAVAENNRLDWLFEESNALYPSIYMSSNLNTTQQKSFVIGRLNEASRIVSKVYIKYIRNLPVYPYFWFQYNDKDKFVSKEDTYEAFENTRQYKMGGIVIWGSSKNVNSKEKCSNLLKHLKNILGPTAVKVREKNKQNFHNII